MNRAEFVKEYSERRARKLEYLTKKEGTEIKDYYMSNKAYENMIINTISLIIWPFVYFCFGMIYMYFVYLK